MLGQEVTDCPLIKLNSGSLSQLPHQTWALAPILSPARLAQL